LLLKTYGFVSNLAHLLRNKSTGRRLSSHSGTVEIGEMKDEMVK